MPQKSEKNTQPTGNSEKPASKKPASKAASAKASSATAAKVATKTVAKKSKPAGPASGSPMIDTGLAAAAAARFLVAKLPSKNDAASTPRSESSFFKQLKGGMAKPAGQAMSNLLDKHGGPMQKSSHEGFGSGGPQQGKNQTFGADVNRVGVPRRTGGG